MKYCVNWRASNKVIITDLSYDDIVDARCGGVEVAGCTVDRTIRVWIPAYPHRVRWPSDTCSNEVKDVSGRPSARIGVGSAR